MSFPRLKLEGLIFAGMRSYKDNSIKGPSATFQSNVSNATAFEFDITYDELISFGDKYYFFLGLSDGVTTKSLRLNWWYREERLTMYTNGNKFYIKETGSASNSSQPFAIGETLTFKVVLGTYTEDVEGETVTKGKFDFYINNEYFGTANYSDCYDGSSGVDLSALNCSDVYITQAIYSTSMTEDGIWRIDNVTFFN